MINYVNNFVFCQCVIRMSLFKFAFKKDRQEI